MRIMTCLLESQLLSDNFYSVTLEYINELSQFQQKNYLIYQN